jgi:hypothetical protein
VHRALAIGLAAAVAALLAVAGCGGGGGGAAVVEPAEPAPPSTPPPAGSIQALLDEDPREDSALVFGTSDFAVGSNRISFLLVDSRGELVEAPAARVRLAAGGLDAAPTIEAEAQLLPVGAPAESADEGDFDAQNVYVAELDIDAPGLYTLLVDPEGASLQGFGQIEVTAQSAVPAVGDPAVPSDTPTLEDGFPKDITTAEPPDVELLKYSVKEALEEGVPFVVTFATPKYCASRVCGPVVDIVDAVRAKLEGSGVRFIHVEIFEGNDPQRGFNRWVQEWNLPTEPWTFIVDGTGTIRARFEGLVTAGELERTVRETLL